MEIRDVMVSIALGEFDDKLDVILDSVRNRRKAMESNMIRQMSVGAKVRFNDRTRPKYLVGRMATVTKINRTKVVVSLDEGGVGRFAGERITVPMGLIDLAS